MATTNQGFCIDMDEADERFDEAFAGYLKA